MIFITVGTQLPFDRLVEGMDRWLAKHPGVECLGQIGRSESRPRHMESVPFMAADEQHQTMERADLIVSHAGMGTMIKALQLGKPVLIMPRRCEFGEIRNDHQVATASMFESRPNIFVAADARELAPQMELLVSIRSIEVEALGPHACPALLDTVRDFIG